MFKKFKFWVKENKEVIVEQPTPIAKSDGVLVETLGLRIHDETLAPLIEQGVSIPFQKSYTFSTSEDNQNQILILLYRGTEEIASHNYFLGAYQIIDIPPAAAQVPQIEITFGVSDRIWITAKDLQTNDHLKIVRVDIVPDSISI